VSRILVIGGYGGFGARLCARLAGEGHHVLVGGRNRDKAEAFCAKLTKEGRTGLHPFGDEAGLAVRSAEPVVVDRGGDVASVLAATGPDLVIDAAGPFQGSDHAVPQACIAAAIPYLDLADGRDFVTGIAALDADAKAAGIPIVSGASSLPALTGAIVGALARGLDRVESVEAALSASNRASGGASVVEAILSYAGQPLRLWRGGRWETAHGWQELRRIDFEVAGAQPLSGRLVALVDVPDLELIPDLLPGRPAVAFRAGTELSFQMLGLWLASWPVRWRWLRSLRPFAPLLLRLYHATLGLGGARSAMRVTLRGWSGGGPVERTWTIVAENGEGLHIPTLAATLLAGDILAGRPPAGARTAADLLTLDRFAPLFATLAVRHGIDERPLPPPLYARAMGSSFEALPPSVRRLHDFVSDAGAAGEAEVTRGRGLLARLVARLLRLPPEGRWPLQIAFAAQGGTESWTRRYGRHVMRSRLSRREDGVVERFGPLRLAFDLVPLPDGLAMRLAGWSLLGIPLPRALAPRISATEREQGGRFHFDVRAALPLAGEVTRYAGWLEPGPGQERANG
jgi:NAD(P)-dependent dehydrogenase (short-subunit alcohol dehydrogenase family)